MFICDNKIRSNSSSLQFEYPHSNKNDFDPEQLSNENWSAKQTASKLTTGNASTLQVPHKDHEMPMEQLGQKTMEDDIDEFDHPIVLIDKYVMSTYAAIGGCGDKSKQQN